VLLVLLLGVTTDYSVFFLAGMRGRLAQGDTRLPAARRATAEVMPIIVTAGLIVAAGSAALGTARLAVLRAFGPGLALTVLIAMVVAVTLTPALIAVFGRLLSWPGRAPRPAGNRRERVARAAAGRLYRHGLRGRPADPDGGRVRHAPDGSEPSTCASRCGSSTPRTRAPATPATGSGHNWVRTLSRSPAAIPVTKPLLRSLISESALTSAHAARRTAGKQPGYRCLDPMPARWHFMRTSAARTRD
jgi:RND superfamily putative drug exporter